MALTLIVLRAILGVEVVHPDSVGSISAGKEVPSIAELDLFAGLDLEGARLRREFLSQYVVDGDFIHQ